MMRSPRYRQPGRRRAQAGFGLVELILVLGVLAVMLVAMFVVYPRVQDYFRVGQATKNISMAYHLINERWPPRTRWVSGAPTIYSSTIISRRGVPKPWTDGDYAMPGMALTNEWGGNVTPSIGSWGYQIGYFGIPARACTSLASSILSLNLIQRMEVNGVRVLNVGQDPSSMGVIANACQRYDPANIDMRWYAR